ncbi:MAG: lipid-A-disaccharide synthase [Cyanobacteria bacterium J06632_22]
MTTSAEPQAIATTQKTPHLYINTGEVSGDLQGALLIEALRRQAQRRGYALNISGMGGVRMEAAGIKLLGNTVAVSSIGIVEALPFIFKALRLQRQAQSHLKADPPDLVVLLDYIQPNLVLGRFVRKYFPNVPMVYYIAPQQWVWEVDPKDTARVLAVTDKLLAIFPGAAHYYREKGADVSFVGHPLVEQYPDIERRSVARQQLGLSDSATVVTLLPASRAQELKYLMPLLLEAAVSIHGQLKQQGVEDVTFLLPVARPDFMDKVAAITQAYDLPLRLLESDPDKIAIAAADLAITKSGTANLEIALMNVPQVVVYRLSRSTAWLIKHVIGYGAAYLSPVNLVEMETIVPELVQDEATPERITAEAMALLQDDERRQAILSGYQRMRQSLGGPGACDRAANEILDLLETKIAV